ncbi:hypothetical protein BOTBODRAFT_34149 [Botryobasidium botryosum FD-172 SS1]|uniref:Zn(2)-C6 fungal-type domain-containing protein n=1 Tax=Botryobasidium botryosum (strain FD-172 SS1) TaxID=930990 RepID=A0A067MAT4_BOTB1|nr:hypothetical protein BOTBODRAFT_34149 [Botryobasidium botryosum FD-172 SS1]
MAADETRQALPPVPPFSSSPTMKRKSDDAQASGKKKPRTRVSYSCSECHRRKQKCDRQVPCGHCVARKVPDLCRAYTPGKAEGDLHMRLARVEQILDMALPQFTRSSSPFSGEYHSAPANIVKQSTSRSSSPSSTNRDDEDDDRAGGTFHSSGKWFGPSALDSVNSAPILHELQHRGMPGGLEESGTPADRLRSLVQEYGVAPHKVSELVQELPPKRLADILIDYYFTSVNYTRYPLYEPHFRSSYEAVFANGLHIQPNDVRFLPLLFVVLAISARLAPQHIGGDESRKRLTSLRYYWASRRTILIAAAVQSDSIELVLARLLTSRFLTFDRKITECWNALGTAVRTALALGLHRDGEKLGLDPFETEYRRRIWSYLYHADRTFALLLGRPQSIQDVYTDAQPPSNIDDSELVSHPLISPSPQPLSHPTPMTFCILRHALASIIGNIVHHFQQVGRSHYSEALRLDAELQRFVHSLPPHYSLQPDTSLDSTLDFLPVHRFLIITEVFFVRMSLHRPYILRKLNSNKYTASRLACVDSAQQDFEVRQAFKRAMPKEVVDSVGGAYREFKSAMISGLILLIDPHNSAAPTLRLVLDTFLNEHAGLCDLDETTKRELMIVELLKNKVMNSKPPRGGYKGKDLDFDLELEDGRKDRERLSDVRTTVPEHSDDSVLLTNADGSRVKPLSSRPMRAPNSRRSSTAVATESTLASPSVTAQSFGAITLSYPSSKVQSPLPLTPSSSASPSYQPTLNPSTSSHSPSWGHVHPPPPLPPLDTSNLPLREPSHADSSPSEEEEPAQHLLDNWCNSVSASDAGTFESSGFGWSSFGDAGANGLLGVPSDDMAMGGVDAVGSDWNHYWENLINQIPAVQGS